MAGPRLLTRACRPDRQCTQRSEVRGEKAQTGGLQKPVAAVHTHSPEHAADGWKSVFLTNKTFI